MADIPVPPSQQQAPKWRPLPAIDRRVVGVLVEKAKTTPDGYPMSVNALRSGCNQKNNRYPLMEVEQEDVEESLERLRAVGAVAEVQGGGRVSRYRHYMYEWLGVDKVELAVMAELLLRGAQTEGELRGRAARMDPIPDVNALRPILQSLKAKGLVISLTPEGRGHVVTHALYEPRELEKLQAEYRSQSVAAPERPAMHHEPAAASSPPVESQAPRPAAPPVSAVAPRQAPSADPSFARADTQYATAHDVQALRRELEDARDQIAQLRKDLDDLWANFR